jgi:hypothetical protein
VCGKKFGTKRSIDADVFKCRESDHRAQRAGRERLCACGPVSSASDFTGGRCGDAARTLPLAIFVLIAIFKDWRQTLIVLAILAGTIQFLDFFVGLAQHDAGKTIGPLVLAILQFAAVYALRRDPNHQQV